VAGGLNNVEITGILGQDPEIRKTPSGGKVANLIISANNEWHSVVILNESLISVAEKSLKKGVKVHVEGQLQTRGWVDKDGKKHYVAEIVLQHGSGKLTILHP
jgi:single-strand DNA-binding protein